MSKELADRSSLWAKHQKQLASTREGYWEYVAILIACVDSASYLEQYDSVDEFLANEATIGKTQFYNIREAAKIRSRLSTRVDSPPDGIKQLNAIGKVPENKQIEVFATATEVAESESQVVTVADIKKAAKPFIQKPLEPTKTDKQTDIPPADAQESPAVQITAFCGLCREIDNKSKDLPTADQESISKAVAHLRRALGRLDKTTFTAPTLEMVQEYAKSKGWTITRFDPEYFWQGEENKDWKLSSGRKMKDWRLHACRYEKAGWGISQNGSDPKISDNMASHYQIEAELNGG